MSVVSANQLFQAFGDRVVLEDVSVNLSEGERVGLVGKNGSGKSTLARILAGELIPDSGEVATRGGASISYLGQEPRFEPTATVREAVLGGMTSWKRVHGEYIRVTKAIESAASPAPTLLNKQADLVAQIEQLGGWDPQYRVETILGHLGIVELDRSVGDMSGGERRRIDLARALVAGPDVAILDEPTNHLDLDTVEWLEEFLCSEFTGTLLLVTHDRYLLDRVVTRTLELDSGCLFSYDGGWQAYLSGKAERLAHEARSEANRQNLLRRELEWLRRSPKARTTKQQARVDRVTALRDQTGPEKQQVVESMAFVAQKSGKTVTEFDSMTIAMGECELVRELDLTVSRGERIGIVGPNGAGKTTLLRALLGEIEPVRGNLRVGATVRFAHLAQERSELDDTRTVVENVADNRDQITIGEKTLSVSGYLSRFLFSGEKQRQTVANLSGGERARVLLARFLLEEANVLLLDEPTNDLDVDTLSVLEEMLVETSATVLFVTHDRHFLERVATSVLSFEGDGKVVRYAGSYQAYRQARSRLQSEAVRAVPAEKSGKGRQPKPKPARKGLTFTEKHELAALMPLIEEAEAAVAAIEAELSDPDLFASRGTEIPALTARLQAARAVVEERIARWEELEDKRADDD